jgi:peptidoglycan hydrolase-like protein with peptidoglycan-binding domain
MRRLWMSLLLVPVIGLAVPTTAMAESTAHTTRTAPAAWTAPDGASHVLQVGMSGSTVKTLQRRLAALKYYPGSINGKFGTSTLEAVWAFYETQGKTAHDYVSSAMWRALAHPKAPKVLDRAAGANRVEVNLADEVLVLYHNNKIQLISHVSTGGGYYYCSPGGGCGYAVTPTGNFTTLSFLPGWVTVPLGAMYNPTFFIGRAYAIHGDTEVPLYPASHGCVRIPMDIAAFFHKLVKIPGERVIIRR